MPSPLNDLDLGRWREYEDILTDSLWLMPGRDRSGAHLGDYHGNFVPQIPYQAMRRFTRVSDVVLDLFLGSGTTLIECRRLGRHGIGVELKPDLARAAAERIDTEANLHGVTTTVLTGDSTDLDGTAAAVGEALVALGRERAQLAVLHPPYHSIIRFSDDPADLSNAASVEDFACRFGRAVELASRFLEPERYLVIVIGDVYTGSEWIPLHVTCMNEALSRGYSLKSIVVKDMQNNRAKRNVPNLWRYRALAGGYYIFKHEYVLFLKKAG